MATPTTILWDRDPHTEAKHRILRRYLQAWFEIISSAFPACSYVDGFSGPGEYRRGEDGSPIIALQVAHESQVLRTRDLRFVFLEEDARRAAHLRQRVVARQPDGGWPRRSRIVVEEGACATQLEPILEREKCWGMPIFALLDQFGGGDVPYPLVQRIATNTSSEVMVTLAPAFFTRFVNVLPEVGDEVFGSAEWRRVAEQPSNRKHAFIAEAYRSSLFRAGFQFVLSFEMVDEGGRPLYLIFGTNSRVGLSRMKDAMWKVDPVRGLRFRDPRDPAQMAFDLSTPMFDPLERFLLALLARGPRTVEQLRSATLEHTVFREAHVIGVLRTMRGRGLVTASEPRITRQSVISA